MGFGDGLSLSFFKKNRASFPNPQTLIPKQKNMSWLKTIGWFLVVVPPICLFGFSIWMIMEIMKDDDNIKAFVMICAAGWFIGLGILILLYFTDFANLAGFNG